MQIYIDLLPENLQMAEDVFLYFLHVGGCFVTSVYRL